MLNEPNSLTDIRVLAGIAEELGRPLGFRTVAAARAALDELGPWDGDRAAAPQVALADDAAPKRHVVLATWRQLVDDARGQDGQKEYHATERPAVLLASAATLKAFDVEPGEPATLTTDTGTVTLPTAVADLPDGVVWAPANNGTNLASALGVVHGGHVGLAPASGGLA